METENLMDAILLAYLGALVNATRATEPADRDHRASEPEDDVRAWVNQFLEVPAIRDAILRAVVKLGPSAVPCLIELMTGGNAEVAGWAVAAILEIGEPALPALRRLTEADEPEARALAFELLDQIGFGPGTDRHAIGEGAPRARSYSVRRQTA